MNKSSVLTVRIDSKLKKQLDKLAKSAQRSRSYLASEAIREFLDAHEWQIEQIKKSIAQADKGEYVPDKEVRRMFDKWKRGGLRCRHRLDAALVRRHNSKFERWERSKC